VTVVFCDVIGSTQLGEKLDPESLRRVMARYFDVMREVIVRHGGTVEKFIGDAVMAVFGVPVLHEDDALRGVRAALEMRAALVPLNEELARDYETTLAARVGVNTGEVVTGTEERLATGDAVNVAARLEQAAAPGEILLGEETLWLVRDAVEVRAVGPLALKGKAEPVSAYRLVALSGEVDGRRPDVPMVGRQRELNRLREAFSQAVDDRSCQLFTILGVAGVGKSRLAHEFLSAFEDVSVLRGRCLSYGEGITYWPVVEVVKQLDSRLSELLTDELALASINGLLGSEQPTTSPEEIAWAFRKLLEAVAAETALLCVFDDIHWGEESFLDLVEHIADLSRNAPIMLLCMARPELLDRRPGWAGGKLNATTVLLEPLDASETDLLIEELLAGDRLDEGLRGRIREAAEGNPFFVEQMVALLEESAIGDVVVPPTIQALLAARLDQLDPSERSVLERGSIEGRVFHRGAVQALAPDEPQVMARLTSLVRKELVRPEKAQFAGDDAFRFRHLLIRDAAYDALPKQIRAELHTRFAEWLEEHGQTLVELDEILGYHLERAYRYRVELGPEDGTARAVAERAAERLAVSGRRAFARGDAAAAIKLLERAAALLRATDPRRIELLPDLAEALAELGDYARAEQVLADAVQSAEELGDQRLVAHARVGQLLQLERANPDLDTIRDRAREAVIVLEREGDQLGLARTWRLLAYIPYLQARAAETEEALERAAEHARRAGAHREEAQNLVYLAEHALHGTIPLADGLTRCNKLLDRVHSTRLHAQILLFRSQVEVLLDRCDEARDTIATTGRILEEIGTAQWVWTSEIEWALGLLESRVGNPHRAEPHLRAADDAARGMGEKLGASRNALELARCLLAQNKLDEAEDLARRVQDSAPVSDRVLQAGWRGVAALAASGRGEHRRAEGLAREALQIADGSDWLELRAEARVDLAEVTRTAGQASEAVELLKAAILLYEQKGNVITTKRVRTRLNDHQAGAA
jgi:class 3 adenylate cyclase/tetratricopeptide (TPR) repeat protein